MRRPSLLALALALFLPALVLGGDDWKKNFLSEKGFNSKNTWERVAAIKGLDPNQPDQLKQLLAVAGDESAQSYWVLRSTVADLLAGKFDDKTKEELKKVLKSGKGGAAEVVATAYGRSKDTDKVDELVDALEKAQDYRVKRAAAIALGWLPAKKGVAALIKALDKEAKNFMVQVHCLEALEHATGEKGNKTVQDWKGWWTGAETNWAPGKGSDESSTTDEDKKSGDRMRTTVKGTDLDFRSRGKGRPLLVLPEYGYEKDYFETYLRNLEESNQILYMKLPGVVDFKNPALENAPSLPAPYYPIDRLVESLEGLREQLAKDKKIPEKASLAIMGHGITCWVAIRYANKYPKSVGRLVLLSPYASDRAGLRDIENMEKAGKSGRDGGPPDLELEHTAQCLQYVNGKKKYDPQGEDENMAITQKLFTSYFGWWGDLEIGRIFGPIVEKKVSETQASRGPAVCRPMGECIVPPFDLVKEGTIQQPCLIIGGERAFHGNPDDCNDVFKQCAAGRVQIIKGARMPMIEENALFLSAMQKHLH